MIKSMKSVITVTVCILVYYLKAKKYLNFTRYAINTVLNFVESCVPGTWSTTGLPPCIKCDIGYYEESYGSVSCSKCPGNKITLMERRSNVSECFGKIFLIDSRKILLKNNES